MTNTIIKLVIGIIVGAVMYYFITDFFGCNDSIRGANRIVTDPNVVYRYITELEDDTTKPWYNFRWKEVDPEIIYQQVVDSNFYETIKYHPVILKGRKEGNEFRIFALSNDSVLSEYVFKGIGRDFTENSIYDRLELEWDSTNSAWVELWRKSGVAA